jgi:hypothetical protein
MVGTSQPGDSDINPIAITAHSASLTSEQGEFPAPFKTLVLSEIGDVVKLYKRDGDGFAEYQYRVVELVTDVSPDDMSIFEKYEGRDVVIAASCYSQGLIGSLAGRAVVVAELIDSSAEADAEYAAYVLPAHIMALIDEFIVTATSQQLLLLEETASTMLQQLDNYRLTPSRRILVRALLDYILDALTP